MLRNNSFTLYTFLGYCYNWSITLNTKIVAEEEWEFFVSNLPKFGWAPSILGGDLLFNNSRTQEVERLSVYHIGKMVNRRWNTKDVEDFKKDVLYDWPYLSYDTIEAARIYALMAEESMNKRLT